jgi:4-amino-4-deoxy-L-arabinose transferase-like glycosyltransferase
LTPIAALAAITLLRLAVAAAVPLAPDEAYYWIWSRALAPGYLDHPPMVALWIRLGTLLAGNTPLGVRLLGPLSVAVGSWLLADAAERLMPGRRAGLAAAALFNATLLAGVGSVIMTPDTPLLFFWTATLWALARFLAARSGRWLVAAGGFAGLALTSKYTAAFLWPGIALWMFWVPGLRPWLRRPMPWAAAALGLGLFVPVVLWNSQHAWAGFLRQGGRVTDWHAARAARFLGELVSGQVGLATPLVFLLVAVGLAMATREAWRDRDPAMSLLAALSLPPVLVFVQHAFGDRVQGNWPAIIYPAAIIAAAALTAPRWVRLRRPAMGLGLAITAMVYLQATTGVLPIPPSVDPIARQLAGWHNLAEQADAARRRADARFVAADRYALASELAWTLPPGTPVVSLDPRWALTTLPPARLVGQAGLLVRPVRDGDPADWPDAEPIGTISRGVDRYALFGVTGGVAQPGAVDLPRP